MRRTRHHGEIICFAPRLELQIGLETALQAEIEGEIILSIRETMIVLEEGEQLPVRWVRLADPLIETKVIIPAIS